MPCLRRIRERGFLCLGDELVYEIHEMLEPFHAVTEEAVAPLKASMLANGYNPAFPIVLYGGKIIDGRHRYAAAVGAGVVEQITAVDFRGDYADARRYAAQANTRVGLSASRRAAIAAEMVNSESGVTAFTHEGGNAYYTAGMAASDWGISDRVIKQMRGVLDYDRRYGTAIHAQTKSGEISSVAAAVRIRDDADATRQRMDAEREAAERERIEREEAERADMERRAREAEERAARLEREKAEREADEKAAAEEREAAAEAAALKRLKQRATGIDPDELDPEPLPYHVENAMNAIRKLRPASDVEIFAHLADTLMQMAEGEKWDAFIGRVGEMDEVDWDLVKNIVYAWMLED